jgi:tetratricopeptide (TPR) repeat protein
VGAASATDLSERWERFKDPRLGLTQTESRRPARFQSTSGNGRYQYWKGAVEAFKKEPLVGLGPASFDQYWKRNGTLPGQIRRPHSQVFQTLAELGLVGTLLLAGFIGLVLVAGVRQALRGPDRPLAAAATAGAVAFVVATSLDWAWDVTVFPAAFMGLAAVLLASHGRRARRQADATDGPPLGPRLAVAGAALLAIVAIAIPLAGTSLVRDSQQDFRAGDLGASLNKAKKAERIQPDAAAPRLQRALVLERAGLLGDAASAASSAVAKEPTSWTVWLVLSRIEAKRGNGRESVDAYRRARTLNPRSNLFPQRGTG